LFSFQRFRFQNFSFYQNSLCHVLGPENVGMITGDATVNHDAPVICCTAEILANIALRDGAQAPVDDVIMDEFHDYSDHSRGAAWQASGKPSAISMELRFPLIDRSSWNMQFA
jgi:hypothetical protein